MANALRVVFVIQNFNVVESKFSNAFKETTFLLFRPNVSHFFLPALFHFSSTVSVHVDDQPCTLDVYDTAGEPEYDSLRSIAYAQTDVCIVCFSVVQPESLTNAREKWVAEARRHLPGIPVILAGTQTDLREDASRLGRLLAKGQRPVSAALGEKTAKQVGAAAYVECSAVHDAGLKRVFDAAILAAMGCDPSRPATPTRRKKRSKKSGGSWRCLFTGVTQLGHRIVRTSVSRPLLHD